MVARSVDAKSTKKTAVTLLLLAAAVAAAVVGVKTIKGESTGAASPIPCATTEEREQYLQSLGIQVSTKSTVAEVKVPEEFDERFENYNLMQQAMGFDLQGLKGQSLKKCVYTVIGREDIGGHVSAVLLVKDGVLAGGHLLCDDTGELLPLFDVEYKEQEQPRDESSLETILPAPAPMPEEPAADIPSGAAETFSPEEADYPTD